MSGDVCVHSYCSVQWTRVHTKSVKLTCALSLHISIWHHCTLTPVTVKPEISVTAQFVALFILSLLQWQLDPKVIEN